MYKHISDYLTKDIYPFHMPGHKRNPHFLPENLLSYDMTEIPGMDVLSSATGIIGNLQEEIATFYGAEHSFLLVNGSSAGILAAVCTCCADDAPLVVPRNAHASVYSAVVLSGARPHYIMPQITAEGLVAGVCPSAFDNMPEGATALVVSPTYEGFVSDIRAIAKVVHAKGGVLIVDEAHGAHFAFDKRFPQSALECGADIVVQSLHKTLPAFSQTAVLHVKNAKNVDTNRIKFFINAVQTSSPSYVFMSSCDYMLRKLWERPAYFDEYLAQIEKVRSYLPTVNETAVLQLLGREMVRRNAIFDIDPGKLLFSSLVDGVRIAQTMAAEYKVEPEMATARHILAMTSVADTIVGFEKLVRAIDGINARSCVSDIEADHTPTPITIPEMVIPPRRAIAMPAKEIPWEAAAGQISAQLIAEYPPGIALVAPGERIPYGIAKKSEMVRVIL